jgi:hypothetical protein
LFLLSQAASKPVDAAIRDLLFQLVREFFAKISYVIRCAAFTAAQENPASGLYHFEFFVTLFAKHFGTPLSERIESLSGSRA